MFGDACDAPSPDSANPATSFQRLRRRREARSFLARGAGRVGGRAVRHNNRPSAAEVDPHSRGAVGRHGAGLVLDLDRGVRVAGDHRYRNILEPPFDRPVQHDPRSSRLRQEDSVVLDFDLHRVGVVNDVARCIDDGKLAVANFRKDPARNWPRPTMRCAARFCLSPPSVRFDLDSYGIASV